MHPLSHSTTSGTVLCKQGRFLHALLAANEWWKWKGHWHLPKQIVLNILKIKWQDRVTNQEILHDVRQRRWKLIGYILRKGQDNICSVVLTWTPEGKRKTGRPKTIWQRRVEAERIHAAWRSWNEARVTETVGENLWRPHVPKGLKWKGEGEPLCATFHWWLAMGNSWEMTNTYRMLPNVMLPWLCQNMGESHTDV